jgi:hypothetical protein
LVPLNSAWFSQAQLGSTSTDVDPIEMAEVAVPFLGNTGILEDKIMNDVQNDGYDEAMRQLEADIHEEAAKAPSAPRAYLSPRFRRANRFGHEDRDIPSRTNKPNYIPSIYPDSYKGPASLISIYYWVSLT